MLQVEETNIFVCNASENPRELQFDGTALPSLPTVFFGLCLRPETTAEEAEALAAMINKHCPAMWAQFYDRPFDGTEYLETGENGLAIRD